VADIGAGRRTVTEISDLAEERASSAGGSRSRALSIVVPAYNEERRLPALLELLGRDAHRIAAAAGFRLHEVIVVDDGSTDGTAALLARDEDRRDLRIIRFPQNRGKGAAVRAGMLAATGSFALLTDVDMSTPLDDLPRLSGALDGGVDVAIGSRSLPASTILVRQPPYRELAGKTFNWLLRLATGLPFRDTQCGFKLFRLETARMLFERQTVEGFAFDAELCVIAQKLGLRVVECPVRWTNNPETRVTLVSSSAGMALDLVRIAWVARRSALQRGYGRAGARGYS
jgi:dolichyl-phosphate beta-glucosyltransferase